MLGSDARDAQTPPQASAGMPTSGGSQAASPDAQARPLPALPRTTAATPRDPPVPGAALNETPSPAPAVPAPAQTGKPGSAPPPASPATQLAPVVVSLVHATDGTQRLIVRLEPPELGRVEVRVDRAADAPVRIDVTVQRPETLQLLLRDQPQLQHALDQAGLPADGRNVTFHIAPPSATHAGQAAGGGFAGLGGGSDSGTHPKFGSQHSGAPNATPEPDDETPAGTPPIPVRWLRAGIDITA